MPPLLDLAESAAAFHFFVIGEERIRAVSTLKPPSVQAIRGIARNHRLWACEPVPI